MSSREAFWLRSFQTQRITTLCPALRFFLREEFLAPWLPPLSPPLFYFSPAVEEVEVVGQLQ